MNINIKFLIFLFVAAIIAVGTLFIPTLSEADLTSTAIVAIVFFHNLTWVCGVFSQ